MDFIDDYLDKKEKDGIDDRSLDILERIEKKLVDQGFVKNNILGRSSEIPHNSYFDYMVDRKLEGLEEPTQQEVWEYMKKITNSLIGEVAFAAEEYRKKENEVRHLKNDINELLKEQR